MTEFVDETVEEVRRWRQALIDDCDADMDKLIDTVRRAERDHADRLVNQATVIRSADTSRP